MGLKHSMRRHFITGLVAILPLALTIGIVWLLIEKIGGLIGVYLTRIPILTDIPKPLSLFLGFITVLIGIYIIGLITSGFLGRWVVGQVDNLMARLPFVKGLYNAARQLVNTIFLDRSAFSKVVIIKYPWEHTYTLAFLTNEDKWKIGKKEYYNIFLPTSPNPTSGYYLLYPVDNIIDTDISIQEGFKIIASGGIIIPKKRKFDVKMV
jgi:uncharacterized membrane protein